MATLPSAGRCWDLTDAPAGEVAAERARVEHDGWGARLLALEDPDGLWDGGACFPASWIGGEPGQPSTATMHTLQTLQLLGLDPASASARRAIGLVAENGRWEHAGQRYFDGRSSPASTARHPRPGGTLEFTPLPCCLAHFGERLVAMVLELRRPSINGVRGSVDLTISVSMGPPEFECGDRRPLCRCARPAVAVSKYLLERGLSLAARAPGPSCGRRPRVRVPRRLAL